MKNTKKVLSVALAGALAFGTMGAAFAATPVMDEKTDSKVVGAVERLSAFGIVGGMEDGKYHEEMKVTREQFAKIIVEALGLGNAADAAKGSTKFNDVESSRWSSGYINVAQGQGLLSGYPDGTFKPAAEVSYAEAVTMLVRALGYKDEFLSGSWPGNYVSKAADTGITSGASFSDSTGKADRGTVAILVDNALDADVVKVNEYKSGEITYKEEGLTLLKDKLSVSKYENVRIIADKIVDDSLEAGEATVLFLKDMDDDDEQNVKNVYGKDDDKTFDLGKDANVRGIIGEEVTLYLNDDDEIIYAETENDDKADFDYVEGTVGSDEVSLVRFDDDYKFADDATVYLFDGTDSYSKIDGEDVDAADLLGKPGKFVIKNDKIVYAEVLDPNEGTPWVLVEGNKDGLITGINETDEDFEMDLTKDGNYDGVVVYDIFGNEMDVKDIEAGNILYVQKQDWEGDDYAVVTVVTDNKVEGKLGKVKSDRVQIGDKEIKVTHFDDTTQSYYSVDGNDTVEQWDESTTWEDDMEDADEENVVAYLDGAGRIAYLTTQAEASSGYKYGVVTNTYADNDKVKVYTVTSEGKGDEITYNVEETDNLDAPIKLDAYGNDTETLWNTEVYEGAVVKFKLNKDGEIAEDEFYMMDKDNYFKMESGKDFGKDSVPSQLKGNGTEKSFSVEDDVVLIDAQGLPNSDSMGDADTDDFAITKWEEFKDDDYNSDLMYYVFTDDDSNVDAKAIVFIGEEGASTSDDAEAIYVVDKWTKGGDDFIEYVNESGDKKEIEVDKGLSGDERPYIAKTKSDGTMDLSPSDKGEYTIVSGEVTVKDGNVITVGGEDYKFASNVVVYEEDTKKSKSNIAKNDRVNLVVENGVTIRVVERLVDGEAFLTTPNTDEDTTKPVITTNLSNKTVDAAALSFTASAEDNKDGSVAVTVKLNGTTVTGNTLTLKEGVNTVVLTSKDKAGNEATKEFTITYEKETQNEDKVAEGNVKLATIGAATIARVTVTDAEVGTKFRVKGETTVKNVGETLQFTATGKTEVEIELLDASNKVVGTITVEMTAGNFNEDIAE